MEKIISVELLGKMVRQRRRAMGLTQSELAELSGVGLSFIVNLEHGKETLEFGKVLAVVTMCGLDLCACEREPLR